MATKRINIPCKTCISFAICRAQLPNLSKITRWDIVSCIISKCSIIGDQFDIILPPKYVGSAFTKWYIDILKLTDIFMIHEKGGMT